MAHDWVLDVLADLKSYAKKNGLNALATELDDATLIAATEIASLESKPPITVVKTPKTPGKIC